MLFIPDMSYSQSFGKVFSSQLEREYLDRERENALRLLSEEERLSLLNAPPTVQQIIETAPTLIHMGGSIRRTDGNHTVWLNGIAVGQNELPDNAQLIFVDGLGTLHVRGAEREYIVKPGQTLNANTGIIREDYELTEEQLEEVNAQVAAREARNSPVRTLVDDQASDVADEDVGENNQAMIQDIVEGLQMLQKARDIQE